MGIYPILGPDRPQCDRPTGFMVAERGNDWVRLRWDGEGLFRLTFDEPLLNVVELEDTSYTLTGLDSQHTYAASLVRLCPHSCSYHGDTVLESPFSRINFQVNWNSIDDADGLHGLTLRPNPASDEVVVDCPVPITAVEAFDEKGACVMHTAQLNTNHYTLNTKHWPSGQYVVIIETPAGKTAKRMTVVR